MRRLTALALLIGLAACGTPQERCIAAQTRELALVSGLIAETEANLARGYALEEVVISTPIWRDCYPPAYVLQPDGTPLIVAGSGMCIDDVQQTVERPAAIDPQAERRKLAGLLERQAVLSKQAAPAVAQCRAIYPE